mgnify:CR=1 FL=1
MLRAVLILLILPGSYGRFCRGQVLIYFCNFGSPILLQALYNTETEKRRLMLSTDHRSLGGVEKLDLIWI